MVMFSTVLFPSSLILSRTGANAAGEQKAANERPRFFDEREREDSGNDSFGAEALQGSPGVHGHYGADSGSSASDQREGTPAHLINLAGYFRNLKRGTKSGAESPPAKMAKLAHSTQNTSRAKTGMIRHGPLPFFYSTARFGNVLYEEGKLGPGLNRLPAGSGKESRDSKRLSDAEEQFAGTFPGFPVQLMSVIQA